MGIITKCVKCDSCGYQYRLRYNVGNKYPQSATFHCQNCGEDLTFGFDPKESILKNISIIPFNRNLNILNLHPELTLQGSAINDPAYFPSLEFMIRQREKGEDGMAMFQSAQTCCILYQQSWDGIKTDFRYLKENRWNLLEQAYGSDKKWAQHKIFMKVFEAADYFLQGRWAVLSDQMMTVFSAAYRHPNYESLCNYLLDFKADYLFNKLYVVMTKYREVEASLLPTLLSQKCGFVPDGFSSTVSWEKVEMIYGDFFEIYGDLQLIPTVLNNLLTRNNFEKFDSVDFTLAKNIDSDKSKRMENFKTNNDLIALCDFYDPGIRNGTHHQAGSFDKESQLIEFRTGKGGRGRKTMTLISYIEHCNEIYARILILLKTFYLMRIMKDKLE